MRMYEGAPRQQYEEVLRSIGAVLDQRGIREISLNETDDGLVIQGLAVVPGEDRPWGDPNARLDKETVTLVEDDLSSFMDEALARRSDRRRDKVARYDREASMSRQCASWAPTSTSSSHAACSSSCRTTSLCCAC